MRDASSWTVRRLVAPALLFLVAGAGGAVAQTPASPPSPIRASASQAPLGQAATQTPSRASVLRGEYGPYRANNDLLYYHLDIRVDPEKKLVTGKNTVRFRMLEDGSRIQLDLY